MTQHKDKENPSQIDSPRRISLRFAGVLLDWRLIDFSGASKTLSDDDLGGIPHIVLGVLARDLKGRFSDFRPIATSNLTGFDLQNMQVTTLNSIYSLSGRGIWVKLSENEFESEIVKHQRAVSRIARGYRSKTKH